MSIIINSEKVVKKQHNFWNHILFHPTDAVEDDWGKKILNQIAEDKAADYVRIYTMFEDIVKRDENGKLVYDFTESDTRIDILVEKGFNLILTYGFVPECLNGGSDDPNEYMGPRYKDKMFCTNPPKDYSEWEEVCYEYTKHITERYGKELVKKWYLMCYNEPDLGFFMKGLSVKYKSMAGDMSSEDYYDSQLPVEASREKMVEYTKLYVSFVKGCLRVDEDYIVGGPAAARPYTVDFFLENLLRDYPGTRIDYVSGHTYGTEPYWVNSGKRPIKAGNNLERVMDYVAAVKKHFPDGNKEIMIDEWGLGGAGFYDLEKCPKYICRETEVFASYFADLIVDYIEHDIKISRTNICLSGQHTMTKDFTGYRNFFTMSFIKKPIYNMYVLGAKIKDRVLEHGGTGDENLRMLATRDDSGNHNIMFTYRTPYFDGNLADRVENVTVKGVNGKRKVVEWRIDKVHTNPYALCLRKGYDGTNLTPEQIEELREEGLMKPVREYEVEANGELKLDVTLSDNCVVMLEF